MNQSCRIDKLENILALIEKDRSVSTDPITDLVKNWQPNLKDGLASMKCQFRRLHVHVCMSVCGRISICLKSSKLVVDDQSCIPMDRL